MMKLESPDSDPDPAWNEEQETLRQLRQENLELRQKIRELSLESKRYQEGRTSAERRLALHPVTGLPSQYRVRPYLKELIRDLEDRDEHENFALAILQLDGSFTMIRKTLKSNIGEWLLYQCGMRLSEFLGSQDKLFHTKDNEFILSFRGSLSTESFEAMIKRLLARFHEPHIFSGFNLSLRAQAGIAFYPKDGLKNGELLHRADIALGVAQEQKQAYLFFAEEFENQVLEKMDLQNAIIKAIEAPALDEFPKQFELYYQPKLHIGSLEENAFRVDRVEAEALLRWHHPTKGLVPPSQFIPLAEENGLIIPMGKWIIYQVTAALKRWEQDRNISGCALNISSRQFQSSELVEILQDLSQHNGFLRGKLTLELTETSLFENPDQAEALVRRFKNLGIKISLDDFGTGYSSLSHLHKFPLDEIKIDRSFIRGFPENPQGRAIVSSLVRMSQDLNIHTVVEGVETLAQARGLMKLGCRTLQGFYFSAALPEKDFLNFCRSLRFRKMAFDLSSRA